MVNHSSNGRYTITMGDGSTASLSLDRYDPMSNQGKWTLSYLSYSVDLYSHMGIPSYDSNVLRYMYDEYIKELKESLLYKELD